LHGGPEPPAWAQAGTESFEADPAPEVRERYAASRDLVREAARDNRPAGPGA
ncbi:MAG TPA: xylulose kinase, partial [Actinomycetes bacterium]|nr:xylulose kinase [Actinomycetes bacterium]